MNGGIQKRKIANLKLLLRISKMPGRHKEANDSIDFLTLKNINSDIVGWVSIPDTNIDYPLLQGSDNTFYLDHNFAKDVHPYGAVFLDTTSKVDDFHTFMYAHNIPTGEMFHDLEKFKDQIFFETHPFIYIHTSEQIYKFQVFSFYQTVAGSDAYRKYISQENILSYKQILTNESLYTRDVVLTQSKVITLSTCSYEGDAGVDTLKRYVLHAQIIK